MTVPAADGTLWNYATSIAAFVLARVAVGERRIGETRLQHGLRVGLWIGAILGMARQTWAGIAFALLTVIFEEWRRRRQTTTSAPVIDS